MPNSAQFLRSVAICVAAIWSTMFSRPSIVVGTLWSTVAMVRSGRRTLRPASRSPSNACGEVTSCTKLQVDVEQRGLALGLDHHVLLPDLFE